MPRFISPAFFGSLLLFITTISAFSDDVSALNIIRPVSVRASSVAEPNFGAEKVADNNSQTRWASKKTDREWIMLDLGEVRTIGRIVLNWETACAEIYQVQVSVDGKKWRVVFADAKGEPGVKTLDLEPVAARYIRVYGLKRKTEWGYSLFAFDVYESDAQPVPPDHYPLVSDFSFDRTALQPAAYYLTDAETAPIGYYPLWVRNLQGYWTVSGTPDGSKESLMCEDGTIEPYRRGWSLMPYLYADGKLLTPQQGSPVPSLEDGYLPLPRVHCSWGELALDQELFTAHEEKGDVSYITYRIRNIGSSKREGHLYVTLRPFQVDPSWQGEGGMSDVFSLRLDREPILVNEKQSLRLITHPVDSSAITYMEGDVMDYISKDGLPPYKTVFDPWGGATAAFKYDFSLAPGEDTEVVLAAPLDSGVDIMNPAVARVHDQRAWTREEWEKLLNRVQLDVSRRRLADVLRSNLAYIFIHRDGPVLQPGSRHYERSWIRDGSVIGIALLRTDHADVVKQYIEWIANHQLFNGDVPCMINADGSVWDWGRTLPEYDGQGAFITLVSEYFRYTGDREFLRKVFPHVVKALQFLEFLRAQTLTEDYAQAKGEKARYYGILPLSVSHEGYAAPGKHSYWDDFFALSGWREGAYLADVAGRRDLIPWMKKEETGLREALLRSIRLTQQDKGISYIPGCADLGDLDGSAAAIAVWPTGEYPSLNAYQLKFTFDQYYKKTLLPRLQGKDDPSSGYVPYEMRVATAWFVLGDKKRAWELLDHFLSVTRPRGWNHWAEVVYGDPLNPGYIGDMPHAWAGADFINALRTAFIYEFGDQLILGLGIREKWLDNGKTVSIQGWPTYYGRINCTLRGTKDQVKEKISGDVQVPAGGILVCSPRTVPVRAALVNGESAELLPGNRVKCSVVPAEIIFQY